MSQNIHNENQLSISTWAEETFGPAKNPVLLVDRALVELHELKEAVESGNVADIGKETADVMILLYRLMQHHGLDINDEIDKKMRINRARSWRTNGDGTGNHFS